jgi:hypothetical protein
MDVMFFYLTVPGTAAIIFTLAMIFADSDLRRRRSARIAAVLLAILLVPIGALLVGELSSIFMR